MGNRSYLYLVPPNAAENEFVGVAEANNLLPTLWEILLADGHVSAAIDYQRVFGDAGTANIANPASTALRRLRKFTVYLRGHPQFSSLPGLSLYLEAIGRHLECLIDEYAGDNPLGALLSADFDELSWLDNAQPEIFIADCIERFRQTWETLEEMIEGGCYEGLEDVLGFRDWNLGFTDWNAWSTVFGLALFQHPYFLGTWDQPRALGFDEFDPEDDEFNGDTYLGADCVRFKENGLWGIRRVDSSTGKTTIVSPPQWQKIKAASESEDQAVHADDDKRCWVKRDGKYALLCLAGPRAGQMLTSLELDDAWGFGPDGLCVAQRAQRMGYLRRDGTWYLEPAWQEAWDFEWEMALIAEQGRSGYIDREGRTIFPPQFDEAFNFNQGGTAHARKGAHWCLLKRDGSVIAGDCSAVEWREAFDGWLVEIGGKKGLFRRDGSLWLPAEFSEISAVGRRKYLIAQDRKARLLDWQGRDLLQRPFPSLRAIEAGKDEPDRGVDFAPGLFVAENELGLKGLVNAKDQNLIPFEFGAIELFSRQQGPRSAVENSHQFRVCPPAGDSAPALYGIWDIREQRLIVTCEYHRLWLMMFSIKGSFGFLGARFSEGAAAKKRGKYSVQLLTDAGPPLFDQEFAWVGARVPLEKPGAMQKIREAILMAWSRGKPVPAGLTWKGEAVGLKPDGTWDA